MRIMMTHKAALGLLAVLVLAGCAESVDPRLPIDQPFTLWGMINPKTDTQAVRVFEIEGTIRLVRPDPLDAVVSSMNLDTGELRVWQDSVVQLPDGDYRHVYWSAFRPQVGHTYRLEVRRSDGATSSAEATVPPPVSLEVLEPDVQRVLEARLPVLIRGDPPSLPRIDVQYNTFSLAFVGGPFNENPVVLSYEGRPTRQADGWLLEIDLLEDFPQIFLDFDQKQLPTALIFLRDIDLRVHVGNETWVSPIGRFDPDFLVEPGVFSNVQNGFGFFGAGYVESTNWPPPAVLLERAGFFVSR